VRRAVSQGYSSSRVISCSAPSGPSRKGRGGSHRLPRLRVCGLACRLLRPGRVGYPELVQVDVLRVDVVRAGIALDDEAEQASAMGRCCRHPTCEPVAQESWAAPLGRM
jgi:hypothetical protein